MCVGDDDLNLREQHGPIHLVAQPRRLLLQLLDLLICRAVDLIQPLPRVVDKLSALIDCASHRGVAVRPVLNFTRIVHVHHVHCLDRLT
jgi:hypothetical protein